MSPKKTSVLKKISPFFFLKTSFSNQVMMHLLHMHTETQISMKSTS